MTTADHVIDLTFDDESARKMEGARRLKMSLHSHPVETADCATFPSMRPTSSSWNCDGCDSKSPSGPRFRCTMGCDFDLCATCHAGAGADRFFSLCFEDVVLPSRVVVLSAAPAHKLLLAATEKDWAQVKVHTG